MIRMKGIRKEYRMGDSVLAALDGVDIHIKPHEFVSIIGPSGSGKSTLMNIIGCLDTADEGTYYLDGQEIEAYTEDELADIRGRKIGFIFQQFNLLPKLTAQENVELPLIYQGMSAGKRHARSEEVLERVGLLDRMDHKPTELSGGQRTKVLLAKLLLEKPDILLLDEPTNYLDVEHITWLKRYLEEYENAFILISHDIPFLNSVVNLIYHMENKELNRYVGDYDHFQEVYAVKKAQKEAAYNRQQQEISELKDFVARNKARVATRNMAMSRQKKLDKMDVIELAKEKPKPEFHFRTARTSGRFVVTAKELVIGYEEPLSRPLTFAIERGEKIVLTGANGIGKTTLLKSILGLIPSLGGDVELGDYLEIGYFEQEMPKGNTNSCIQEIWEEFPSYTQYEVRAALAKCGLTTQHIESLVRVLSGGEQAKVRLCKLINRETNLLVLDEPTNHLDVDAKEELKNALKEYKGTVLMVCHEPEFYDGLATSVWDCSEWTTKVI